MKSTDGRPQFKNAEDDIRQHFIMNDDITLDEVFSSRVGLFDNDELYSAFLLSVVASKYSHDPNYTEQLVSLINAFLHQENEELYLYGYGSNGRPVYRVNPVDQEYSPRDIAENKIPLYVDKHPRGNTMYAYNHSRPERSPSFVLAYNSGWDDYGVCTWFDMFYYDGNTDSHHVGVVKIIHTSYDSQERIGYYHMSDHIDDTFEHLSSDYCSLGQNEEYYVTLRRLLPDNYKSVLWALRDCAISPRIEEKFSNHPYFYSLIREREAEEALNDVCIN